MKPKQIDRPKYTQVPNVILDNISSFSNSELRVLLCMCRQEFGWHRDCPKMSISFIMNATGMSHQGVINGTNTLINDGVISREVHGNSYKYSINFGVVNGVESQRRLEKTVNGVEIGVVNGVEIKEERSTKKEKKEKGVSEFSIPAGLQTRDFLVAWDDWVQDRKARKKPITPLAAKLQLRNLNDWGVKKAIQAIETAIEKGWTGLFEPKDDKRKTDDSKTWQEIVAEQGTRYDYDTEQ